MQDLFLLPAVQSSPAVIVQLCVIDCELDLYTETLGKPLVNYILDFQHSVRHY